MAALQPRRLRPRPAVHRQVLPGWLTVVGLAALLALITAKTAAKTADLASKEARLVEAGLRRLAAVDAQGGDLLERTRTPLLAPLLDLEGSGSEASEASPPPRLAFGPPAAHGPQPDGAGSAASSSMAGPSDEETGQAAGSHNGLAGTASSQPLPIGSRQGSAALPMLTPVL